MSSPDALVKFIVAREGLRLAREDGLPEDEWTTDAILRAWRFCNVRREDDRVTRWIARYWREPHREDPDVWFAMLVARFINWPPTLLHLGYSTVVPWDPTRFLAVMRDLKRSGRKVYTGAYMVRADATTPDKALYQVREVFTPMWEARWRLRPQRGDTLNSWHMLLGQFHGLGSFMAAQVVADVKHTPLLIPALDWDTWAASGPGSRRGLSRVLGSGMNRAWSEEEWRLELGRLREIILHRLPRELMDLSAQDLQNCLCEFDKYERVRLGEGRPRTQYRSHASDYTL